jgi:hypothetical protein
MRTIVKIARAQLTDYSHTINSLLTKRAEHFNEAIALRDKLAEIKNDIGTIDLTLESLGYRGDIYAICYQVEVPYGHGGKPWSLRKPSMILKRSWVLRVLPAV